MKKFISILLILSSLLFVLCGCTTINVNTNTEKKLIAHNDYIENLYGKDFFENYCNNCNIEIVEPTVMADSYNYENGNSVTSIQVNSKKDTDEIYYIKVMALTETNIDDFLKACELGFKHDDEIKEWIKSNINKTKTEYTRGMYYNISQAINKPILEIYTFNGQLYEKEQEKKAFDLEM